MITVLYFANLKEITGKEKDVINCEEMTIKELQEWIVKSYEGFNFSGILVAINEEFAESTDTIRSGDTVAFIPPVSGG